MRNCYLKHFSIIKEKQARQVKHSVIFCFLFIYLEQSIQEWTKQNLLKQTISLQIFKRCLPQILLGPFLNTLSHLIVAFVECFFFCGGRRELKGGEVRLKCLV